MESICLELNQEEMSILMEAMDNYTCELMKKHYSTKEDNRKIQVMTNINNEICRLNQL